MLDKPSLREAIEFAIKVEEIGIEFYTKMSYLFTEQEELKDLFAQLAKDENAHKIEFMGILETIPEQVNTENEDDILLKALAFEKETHQYFYCLKDIIGESPPLNEIINAEKRHIIALMKVIMIGDKFRGLEDNT